MSMPQFSLKLFSRIAHFKMKAKMVQRAFILLNYITRSAAMLNKICLY